MPDIEVNGVRLYYEERGDGDPLLCIHGTGSSAMVWRRPALEELAALGRVIVYDRRGCTRSERPEPYATNVRQHAEDAAALLQALDAWPAVVIGRSYGGETAIQVALSNPARVRALVLLEAAALSLDDGARAWADALEATVREAAAQDPASVAEVFYRRVAGDEQWDAFPPRAKAMFVANGPAIVAELRGGYLDATAEDLSHIAVPALLVAGEASPPAFARVTERMGETIPDARVERVPGGHLIDPGEPAVLEFVRSVLHP